MDLQIYVMLLTIEFNLVQFFIMNMDHGNIPLHQMLVACLQQQKLPVLQKKKI